MDSKEVGGIFHLLASAVKALGRIREFGRFYGVRKSRDYVVSKDGKNRSTIDVMKNEERKALLERGTLLYISSSPDPLFQLTSNMVYYC